MVQSTAPQYSSFRSDSGNLDLVRAVAVLSVFFAHLHQRVTGIESQVAWHFAQMGVLIFFVHTSMVLMLSLERTKLRGKSLFAAFYLRRSFRIYPLAMFCVTCAMLLNRSPEMANTIRHWKLTEYLSNMALTTNLTYSDNMVGGLWTLPIEVQMYLTLPFLYLIGCSWPAAALYGIWILAVPAAILQPHVSERINVVAFAPCFISGVIAWKLSTFLPRRLPGWLWPLGFVAVWPIFLLSDRQNHMYYRWAFCLALGLLIPRFQEVSFRPLQRAAQTIAKYSYGIYLSHVAIIMWSFGLPVATEWKWAIFLLLAVVSPVAMYHLIEHPMIGAGQKVAQRFFPATGKAQPALAR